MGIGSYPIYILIILLVVLNGFSVYSLLQLKGRLKSQINATRLANKKVLRAFDERNYYLQNLTFQLQLNNKLDDRITVTDLNQNIVGLRELVKNEPLLIFRHKDLDCNVCIDSLIIFIKQYTSEKERFRIAHLVSYKTKRDLMVFARNHNLWENVYYSDDIEFPMDHLESPYMFILNENMTVLYPIIPQYDRLDFLKHYFELFIKFKHQ